ncbi:MAG TPA: hypothetical protein DEF39_02150 [Hungateiclostridium thermocellum]|uniref:Anti-sigma-I factor RsgI3 n=2 Tax=Acetivibrio thermocellus TaxID=1515 RepID=RSGI3_ACET2|nr:PA14 domain-containing protein [Acetivibrio thermocellus]A3DC75.1 RecName: Full=Anti-sigma-I factor RsgI3 [Acetivibrio thermocellus ATCC 27405]ABN51554.1 PA14 domain protein [Acetivibrio thermocellus ATCC 27405]ADU74961.1 PA14 domain protein [Acetivibrio thermocellus DSM 1313]AIY67765.1 anti-sigma factor RsgI3 [Acetivibrio thermocellus ATCC 27405]ALX08922.1 anti-sigma factor RsgI3 [Acetivibrio thermocellus AD2]ANV76672.1 PA14 domain protein [Acetivibrio thermocellus DSM 2360]
MDNIGVIIKIEGNEAIVMTDDCSFKKVPIKDGMHPGQKILVPNNEVIQKENKSIKRISAVATGIAAVFLMVLSLIWINKPGRPDGIYAYIDVDINPSLNFLIDREGKVKALNPLNDDAQEIIRGVEFEDMFFSEALTQIIKISKAKGIIDENKTNYVLICAALDDNYNLQSDDKSRAQTEFEEFLDGIRESIEKACGNTVIPQTVKVPFEYLKMAKQNDVSMGRYLVYQKLEDIGVNLSIEELKSLDIDEILKKYGVGFDELFKSEYTELPYGTLQTGEDSVVSTEDVPVSPKNAFETMAVPTNTPSISTKPSATPAENPTPKLTQKPTPVPAKTGERTSTTPTPTPAPTVRNGTGSGLRGEYYNNMDFSRFQFVRIDPCIDFDWGEGTPDQSIGKDTYSVRWTGKVEPRYSETYTFYTVTDDGVRLWVDGVLLIDKWKSQSATEHSEQIYLEAGKKYDIKMEYYQHVRAASAKLMWSSKSQQKEIIPSSQLYPSDGPLPQKDVNGLSAEYYGDAELKDKRFTRIDDAINFNWDKDFPVGELKDGKFSVRWVGKIDTRYTEEYTFHTVANGGVRVWINNVLIIDNWQNQGKEAENSGKIELKAGRQYDIKVEYCNYGEPAFIKLLWSSQRQKKEVVPSKNLFAD